ncbi:hypothetical protein N0V86_000385 [Didymella sp. IMI 355093]|nr:hypothetical protein N0V86_000385 [Didymella sp. IMI 355093]
MSPIPPDERTVYLAFKNVFKGTDAKTRTDKTIKKKIQKYEGCSEEIRALVQEYNLDNVRKSIKTLLEGDIFGLTLKAKMRFPELFDVSSAQSAERAASEAEAAKTEADAMGDVTVGPPGGSVSTAIHEEVVQSKQEIQSSEATSGFSNGQKFLHPETFTTRSLYPLYLPAKGQRRLLSKVQDILEHTCFTFAKVKSTQELHNQGWDSPDCVELNSWMGMFRSRENLFDAERVATLVKPFSELLSSIAQIRHTAVHRLRITAGKVESSLADAETLAALLGDDICSRQLTRLRRETHSVIEEFGRNKDLLEVRYVDKRKEIAARRAELDRIETAAWEAMLVEDKQYQCFAGVILEEMVNVPETAFHSRANSEADETSEEETSVESESEPDFCRVPKESPRPLSLHMAKASTTSL